MNSHTIHGYFHINMKIYRCPSEEDICPQLVPDTNKSISNLIEERQQGRLVKRRRVHQMWWGGRWYECLVQL